MRFGMWGDVRSLIRLVRRQRFLPTPLVCLVLLLVAGGAGSSASAAGTVPWHGIIILEGTDHRTISNDPFPPSVYNDDYTLRAEIPTIGNSPIRRLWSLRRVR